MKMTEKIVVLTGGAGELGQVTAKKYLEAGAFVILTGRNQVKLESVCSQLKTSYPQYVERVDFLVMDGSNPESLLKAKSYLKEKFGKIDILINNAGSVGPKAIISDLPINDDDIKMIRSKGSSETETVLTALKNLIGCPWLTTVALKDLLSENASIINISTVFSKTEYYGRAAYVVPKAGLNVLSKAMAKELGRDPRQIRVNTVFPSAIASDRINNVFKAMDEMKKAPQGTTRKQILEKNILVSKGAVSDFVTKDEVAETVLFLGSDESRSHTGEELFVTKGMRIPNDGEVKVFSSPLNCRVALEGRRFLIIAGEQVEGAISMAQNLKRKGASVSIAISNESKITLAKEYLPEKEGYFCHHLNPFEEKHWQNLNIFLKAENLKNLSVIVISPETAQYGNSVLDMDLNKIKSFIENEIHFGLVVAKNLDQIFRQNESDWNSNPSITFVSDQSEQNPLAAIRNAGNQQLIRVWRDECQTQFASEDRRFAPAMHQILGAWVRDKSQLQLISQWIVSLSEDPSPRFHIDISLDSTFESRSGKQVSFLPPQAVIEAIHVNRVALITGGSEGIGGEITLQLALAGAKIVVAERSTEKLQRAWTRLMAELENAGYYDAQDRIHLIPNVDVAKEESLNSLVRQVIEKYGRIDFLINNAGLVGAEQMMVDIPLETWEKTIYGNLTSNYNLMMQSRIFMKNQKFGHIINMSSYFGGRRHGSVPYSNRADYAVSKAGQQAMVETLSPLLGPDILINAYAPGPVDGKRLNGVDGQPGLFERRGRLIFENYRLNMIHEALLRHFESGGRFETVEKMLKRNRISEVLNQPDIPKSLKALASELSRQSGFSSGSSKDFLMSSDVAVKLLNRLKNVGYLAAELSTEEFLRDFNEPPPPFWDPEQVINKGQEIKNNIIAHLALNRMPSDRDLAHDVVFGLANKTVTGEILFPSCGFKYEGFQLGSNFCADGESLSAKHSPILSEDMVARMERQIVFILGDAMTMEIAQAARSFFDTKKKTGPERVVILTQSLKRQKEIEQHLGDLIHKLPITTMNYDGHSFDKMFTRIINEYGFPQVVISFPFSELSETIGADMPSTEEFKDVVKSHLTNHFLVAKRTSLIDRCQTVFITSPARSGSSPAAIAMGKLVRMSLIPLTLAAGKEGLHLPTKPMFYQINPDQIDEDFYRLLLMISVPISQEAALREVS